MERRGQLVRSELVGADQPVRQVLLELELPAALEPLDQLAHWELAQPAQPARLELA